MEHHISGVIGETTGDPKENRCLRQVLSDAEKFIRGKVQKASFTLLWIAEIHAGPVSSSTDRASIAESQEAALHVRGWPGKVC